MAKKVVKKVAKKVKKKTVTKNKEVNIVFVLDRSGSMAVCLDGTISGFNEYITKLKNDKFKYVFSLVTFDTVSRDVMYSQVPIEKVEKLTDKTFIPRGGTPLLDTIGKTINDNCASKDLLFIIMTDGEENASKEFTKENIKALIAGREKQGWTFVYLGANQDAWQVGESFGAKAGNIATYSSSNKGTTKAFTHLAKMSNNRGEELQRGIATTDCFYQNKKDLSV